MGQSSGADYQPRIRELPAHDRPRERLKQYGAASLSNAELLAIILRTGTPSESVLNLSTRLLAKFGGLSGLARAGLGELCLERGFGDAKGAQLKAALEQEELRLVLLNTKNQVLSIPCLYKGSVNTSLVRTGELFRQAIRENCPALIVVHNHPSGDPSPSPEDVNMTKQMIEAGKLLDIAVLDHLIIGNGGYISLKEQGLAFD